MLFSVLDARCVCGTTQKTNRNRQQNNKIFMHSEKKSIGKAGQSIRPTFFLSTGLDEEESLKNRLNEWTRREFIEIQFWVNWIRDADEKTNKWIQQRSQQWACYFSFPIEIRTFRLRVINDSRRVKSSQDDGKMKINKSCQVIDPESFISSDSQGAITRREREERRKKSFRYSINLLMASAIINHKELVKWTVKATLNIHPSGKGAQGC